MSHNNLSIRQCAISLSFSSIISFKLLHVSYILNLKALFWSDIWSHFSGLGSLKSLSVFLIDRLLMKQISPCLHRYVRPGNGFVPKFPLFEKVDVNGDNEQALFTFLKVGHCLIKHYFQIYLKLLATMQEKPVRTKSSKNKISGTTKWLICKQ